MKTVREPPGVQVSQLSALQQSEPRKAQVSYKKECAVGMTKILAHSKHSFI